MSTLPEETTLVSATPPKSKKRRTNSETPETSKKRRKHTKADEEILNSQDTSASASKKEKRKKKKDKSESIAEDAPSIPETQDIELPDATEEADSSKLPVIIESGPISNGIEEEDIMEEFQEIDDTLLQSQEPSCFYQKRLSLQVPIPAISLASPSSSLLSLHLAPLLLTYFPPAEGIVISFSDPVISAKPSHGVNLPIQAPKSGKIPRVPTNETFARCADAFGVCWVWLTATFLVFRPQTGDGLKGWTNVMSEGFVGLVSYNYFQTAVAKSRIPNSWMWDGPTRESRKKSRKGKLRDEEDITTSQTEVTESQDMPYGSEAADSGSGAFVDTDGNKIAATQTFRVVDVEMVPGHDKDRWTLQIDGSLLSPEEESEVIAQERQRFEQINHRSRSRSKTPGIESGEMPLMGGNISLSQQASRS